MKRFPKTLYVKIEHEREPKDDFFIASNLISDLAEPEETVQIAIYDLINVKNAVNKTELVN